GETDGGYLRIAIGTAGNEILVRGVRIQALDGLDADHALMLGLVREHRRPRDVADGIDPGHIGLAVAVDHDDSAIGFNTNFFQAQILDIADHPDRRNHPLEFYRLRLLADRKSTRLNSSHQ